MMSRFQNIINNETPVLVDFFAEWCGPCQTMAPILKQVKNEMGEDLIILKVDVDKNNKLATSFGIRTVPTLKLFKSGKEVWSGSGIYPVSALKHLIKQHTSK